MFDGLLRFQMLKNGRICGFHWTFRSKKCFSFSPPTRGSAPGPRWGLCPQTPVIGSRSMRSPWPPLCQILNTPLVRPCTLHKILSITQQKLTTVWNFAAVRPLIKLSKSVVLHQLNFWMPQHAIMWPVGLQDIRITVLLTRSVCLQACQCQTSQRRNIVCFRRSFALKTH